MVDQERLANVLGALGVLVYDRVAAVMEAGMDPPLDHPSSLAALRVIDFMQPLPTPAWSKHRASVSQQLYELLTDSNRPA